MKVAYNSCFGGFGLSPLALEMFAEKKGITLTWYERSRYPDRFKRLPGTPRKKGCTVCAFTKDQGASFSEYEEGTYYYPNFDSDEARTDPDLITVIEELGERANGDYASLATQEIPDGAEFEITYYDGNESVEPPRPSW